MFKSTARKFLFLILSLALLSSCSASEQTLMEKNLLDKNEILESQLKELEEENEELQSEISAADEKNNELQSLLEDAESEPEYEYINSCTYELNGYNISYDVKQAVCVDNSMPDGTLIMRGNTVLAAISIEDAGGLTAFRYVQNRIDYLKERIGSENLEIISRNEVMINGSTGYEAVIRTDTIEHIIAVRVKSDYLIISVPSESNTFLPEQVALAETLCKTIKVTPKSNRQNTQIPVIVSTPAPIRPKANISAPITSTAPAKEKTEIIVYRGKTGTKYHKETCPTLKGGGIPITLETALRQNRQPCKVCGG